MDLDASIRKVRAGDIDEYGVVVRLFQGRLRAFIASFCPDRDLVDEVAQRTFVWAYEHLKEYRTGTRFYSWLKAIGRNLLLAELEAMKRNARNKRAYLRYLQASASRRSLEAESPDRERDLLDALRHCLRKLTPRSQSMIRRRYESEDSIVAMAESLGTTPGTVKVTLFRIRQSLKKCVERLLAGAGGVEDHGDRHG
ncbi:MAG: sigma-70 family RNA polymerase sigma factor [Planctomycetes bacterium]|nr:sigma-70 family RNA polymerase sigma factor [Planctomycetota bacterium]